MNPAESKSTYQKLKWSIWAYFLLLIFEGALRKWIFPGLSAPLLIVRDPLAIWLIYLAWSKRIFPLNKYVVAMSVAAILGTGFTLIVGHGNIPVAVYGARILLIHFPLMFIIGRVMTQEDVIRLGKVVILLAIPMAVLIALQFYSPQSAWVNRGVGGDLDGAGFSGALGYYRPPGTFSFTTGVSQFFSLTACFTLYFWIAKVKINRLLLIAASVAVLVAIPISISRTLFFSVLIAVVFCLIIFLRKPKSSNKLISLSLVLAGILLVLSQTEFFQTGIEAFTSRFETASSHEGGLGGTLADRYLGNFIDAFRPNSERPFFGYGLGMGTNVGSQLLIGERSFLFAEEEWDRLIGEMGLFMGLFVILIRLALSLSLTIKGFKKLESGDFLPWILLSFGLLIIPQGQWAQPTTLGFSTLIGGLIIASLSNPAHTLKPQP